jgi:hypothetical protein
LAALPFINQELPINSPCHYVNNFTQTIRSIHLSHKLNDITWLINLLELPVNQLDYIIDYKLIISSLFDKIISKCRFGSRWDFALSGSARIDSAISLMSNLKLTDSEPVNLKFLSLSLQHIPEHKTVDFVSLLNKSVGNKLSSSTFYYGGNRQLDFETNCLIPHLDPGSHVKFMSLPHYLFVIFDRPRKDDGYHSVTIEMPMDLDLGRFLHKKESNQRTFYRLHGFVTQTNGHFLTYTRNHASWQWFRAEDEKILDVDLDGCICSKGVMLAAYKLKEAPARP